ncbi:MAG TPA: hypothetical protein VJ757_03380 [Pseudonocardiaceae bacterium]|nr:hypothetical protein [Pseudonocardiaceae bacterium]
MISLGREQPLDARDGTVRGKDALRAYLADGLRRIPTCRSRSPRAIPGSIPL